MTHHIVMWKFKPEVADADKPKLLADMASHLEGLVGQVPGLVELHFVANPLPSSTHDMALVSVLEKPEDVAVYSNHPAHQAVANTYVRPYTCQRAALDYQD
ncbi:Dabb family protein [uncultured Gemmiger sp.]|uniref:Dabb family protein n=1 Tax=uncultured Gemmiger sp. TaxID=1623490 RepID=UPI0025EDB438|nr:Dabb family protein [uncultured Gemmiger sp.]